MQSCQDLQESYDFSVGLANMQMHFKRYDVLDVFTIVIPSKNAIVEQTGQLETDNFNVTKTVFLFDRYAELTADQVAESCKWYTRWPDATTSPWFRENLSLSYDYLCNHMTPQLWGKVLEDLLPYWDTQGMGGPLVFFFMMKRLQVNSQLVVETIQGQLKTLRIDQYEGESVDNLVSHIKVMLTRLKSLEKRIDGRVVSSNVPHDIGKTLISLFQTSSDPKFNEVFHNKEINAYEQALTQGNAAYGSPDMILDLATSIYQNRMASKEGWTGQFHKVNETLKSAPTPAPAPPAPAPAPPAAAAPAPPAPPVNQVPSGDASALTAATSPTNLPQICQQVSAIATGSMNQLIDQVNRAT
ncbi:unnamed protein product [Cylindrotheca closterium]|uniref:Uncharacterized protein n=1 Tax=Cylindrotheca closterium TaxID=2856 RepID=A0AAD2GCS6_9STRA|nr:unnamed protein product [Cylindrotheca closterium]